MKIPRMGRPARRQLIRLGRRSSDPYTALRFQAVARLGMGRSTPEVAAELDVATSTVVRAADRFLADGIEGNVRPTARQRHVQGRRAVRPRPDTAAGLLARGLRMGATHLDPGAALSADEAGRLPSGGGVHDGAGLCRASVRGSARPSPSAGAHGHGSERLRGLAAIRRLEARASAREPVVYSDEVDIHLNPKIGRDWDMLRGQQRRILTPGKNQKFYLAGALDVRTGRLHTTGAFNAALFCQLLWLLASRYRRARRVHVVVDNYGIHKALLTRKTVAALRGRIVLHFLPPYCPDANRIERVWQDFHANVTRNHRCKDLNRLLENARRYLDGYAWKRASEKPGAAKVA